MFNDTTYIVFPDGATDPFSAFLVKVGGGDTSSYAYIYERRSSPAYSSYKITDPAERSDFVEEPTLSISRKWDGCTEISIDEHYCGYIPTVADKIALFIKTASYFCDQSMAEEGTGSYDFNTREKALQHLNCGDGADDNPGITYEEFIPVPEEDDEGELVEAINPLTSIIAYNMGEEVKKLLGIEEGIDTGDSLVISPPSEAHRWPQSEPFKPEFRNSLAVSIPFTKKDK